MNPQEAFLNLLIAAMKDAVEEGALSQLKTEMLNSKSGKTELLRIIVIPEKTEWSWPKHAPLGTQTKGN